MKFSLITVMVVGVLGFIVGMAFVIVVSCLILSSRLSEEEERELIKNEIDRCR